MKNLVKVNLEETNQKHDIASFRKKLSETSGKTPLGETKQKLGKASFKIN